MSLRRGIPGILSEDHAGKALPMIWLEPIPAPLFHLLPDSYFQTAISR
jgi:hypothetical protein